MVLRSLLDEFRVALDAVTRHVPRTVTWGSGSIMHSFSRLASLLADHNSSTSYSCLMSWIRCRLSFALIRAAILCIRGSRSSRHRPVHHEHELAVAESRLQG